MNTIIILALAFLSSFGTEFDSTANTDKYLLLALSDQTQTNWLIVEIPSTPNLTNILFEFARESKPVVQIQWDGNVIYDTNAVTKASAAFWNAVSQMWPEFREAVCAASARRSP